MPLSLAVSAKRFVCLLLALSFAVAAHAERYRYRMIKRVPIGFVLSPLGFSSNDHAFTYLFSNKYRPNSWSFERYNLDTKRTTILTQTQSTDSAVQQSLMSPNGRYIAFMTYQDIGGLEHRSTPDLFLFDTKENKTISLTDWKTLPRTTRKCNLGICGTTYPVGFSRDGKFLYYTATFDGLTTNLPYSLRTPDPTELDIDGLPLRAYPDIKLIAYEIATGMQTLMMRGYDCAISWSDLGEIQNSPDLLIPCRPENRLIGLYDQQEDHFLDMPIVLPTLNAGAPRQVTRQLFISEMTSSKFILNSSSGEISGAVQMSDFTDVDQQVAPQPLIERIECFAINRAHSVLSYIVAKEKNNNTRAIEWREKDLVTGVTRVLPVTFKLASIRSQQGLCILEYTPDETKIIGKMHFDGWMAGKRFRSESFVYNLAKGTFSFPSMKATHDPRARNRGVDATFSRDQSKVVFTSDSGAFVPRDKPGFDFFLAERMK